MQGWVNDTSRWAAGSDFVASTDVLDDEVTGCARRGRLDRADKERMGDEMAPRANGYDESFEGKRDRSPRRASPQRRPCLCATAVR